jgi:hypothetical protein
MSSVFVVGDNPIKMLFDYIKSMWPVNPFELLEFYRMTKKSSVLFQNPDLNNIGDDIVYVQSNTSRPQKQTTDGQYVFYKDIAHVTYTARYYPDPDRILARWHTRSFLEKILRTCDLEDKGVSFVYLIGGREDSNVSESTRSNKEQDRTRLNLFVGLEYTLFKERVS